MQFRTNTEAEVHALKCKMDELKRALAGSDLVDFVEGVCGDVLSLMNESLSQDAALELASVDLRRMRAWVPRKHRAELRRAVDDANRLVYKPHR